MHKLLRAVACAVTAIVLFVVLPGAVVAQSQATTGVIEGVVTDETGGVLAGASVSMKNTDTNFEKSVTTDGSGRFRGLLLPLGPYRVTFHLQGFASLVRDGVQLAVGQTINLPVTLTVAAVGSESVVTAEAPVVEATRVESSTVSDPTSI